MEQSVVYACWNPSPKRYVVACSLRLMFANKYYLLTYLLAYQTCSDCTDKSPTYIRASTHKTRHTSQSCSLEQWQVTGWQRPWRNRLIVNDTSELCRPSRHIVMLLGSRSAAWSCWSLWAKASSCWMASAGPRKVGICATFQVFVPRDVCA